MASGGGTWHTSKSRGGGSTRFFAKRGQSRRAALGRKRAQLNRGRSADANFGLG